MKIFLICCIFILCYLGSECFCSVWDNYILKKNKEDKDFEKLNIKNEGENKK